MYFNGLPLYYHLKEMNMGRCYDSSAILALALGEESSVCRGNLATMEKIMHDGEDWGHGWVEMDGKVYDTTWQIMCDKDVYYKTFEVEDHIVIPSKKFFEDCKDMADWTIRSKEYYYENYVPMVKPSVILCSKSANMALGRKDTGAEKRAFYEKLKEDLPDISKMPEPSIELFGNDGFVASDNEKQ